MKAKLKILERFYKWKSLKKSIYIFSIDRELGHGQDHCKMNREENYKNIETLNCLANVFQSLMTWKKIKCTTKSYVLPDTVQSSEI